MPNNWVPVPRDTEQPATAKPGEPAIEQPKKDATAAGAAVINSKSTAANSQNEGGAAVASTVSHPQAGASITLQNVVTFKINGKRKMKHPVRTPAPGNRNLATTLNRSIPVPGAQWKQPTTKQMPASADATIPMHGRSAKKYG